MSSLVPHGPPWECRLRRSASPRTVALPIGSGRGSVREGIPTEDRGEQVGSVSSGSSKIENFCRAEWKIRTRDARIIENDSRQVTQSRLRPDPSQADLEDDRLGGFITPGPGAGFREPRGEVPRVPRDSRREADRPRRALVRHIFDSHKHFDADELVPTSAAGRQVSRSTVYRTLRLLVEAGLLRELRLTNRTAYEHDYGYPSHDHLHCTECNTVVEFRNDDIRQVREAIGREQGSARRPPLHHHRRLPGLQPIPQPPAAARPDLIGLEPTARWFG